MQVDTYPAFNSFQALFYLEAAITAVGTLYLAFTQRQAHTHDDYEDAEERDRRELAQQELSRLIEAAKAENQLEFVQGLQAQAQKMHSLTEHLGDELKYVKLRQRNGMAIQCGTVGLMFALLIGFFCYQVQTTEAIHSAANLQAPATATETEALPATMPGTPTEVHPVKHIKPIVKAHKLLRPKKPYNVHANAAD